MSSVYEHFVDGFRRAVASRESAERRIGAELKFPLVASDGSAADLQTVHALWDYLQQNGWEPMIDRVAGNVVGARVAGPLNDTVASCETGYCKIEFSLAHVANLFELTKAIGELRELLAPFAREHDVRFLGYGIQPVTPPSGTLLFKKARSSFWDKAVPSNLCIPPEQGDDVHLFTVNAGSHVHVSTEIEDATRAVNVLNGFAGPQIALTAHSSIWKGKKDDEYVCVNEKLWDWWRPAQGRSGMPERAFTDLEEYVETVEQFAPIYVNRNGQPVLLPQFTAFGDYFASEAATGQSLDGETVALAPHIEDIRVHNSCYWYTARISQYFTVENRVFDQQPPDELECVSALTLGLVSALDEAWAEISRYSWDCLREARWTACRSGLAGECDAFSLAELAATMLDIARLGLARRKLGEEQYLEPLGQRLREKKCPSDVANAIFAKSGIPGLVQELAL